MPSDPAQPPRNQPRSASPDPLPGAHPTVTGEMPAEFLEAVAADAADRAGVPIESVQVIRADSVQWRDGSLGCPEPGMMYIQMIVDGYWLEVEAGGSTYDYRLDGQGHFVLCERPDRQPPYSTNR